MIMFGSVIKYCLRSFRIRSTSLSCSITLLTVLMAAPLNAQVVASYSFEDGSADGWSSFNGATVPVATNAAAEAGSFSLLTTTNSSGSSSGPSLSLGSTLLAGAKYTITAFVQLTPGEAMTDADFTIRRTDPSCSGGTCFDTVGAFQVAVSSSGWAQIGGTYTVSTTETGLQLYAQLVGPTTAQSFYLDNVVITEVAPPPGGTPVVTYTWKDGGLDGWTPFGSIALTNAMPSPADPVGNPNALLTTGRSATYEGPSLNLLGVPGVTAGATYAITAYVMLDTPDASGPTVTMSTKTANCATAGTY